MKICLVAVGKVRQKECRSLVDEYWGRLRRYIPVEYVELKEGRGSTRDVILQESSALWDASEGSYRVLLYEGGKEHTSLEFAELMQGFMNAGMKKVSFLVGGSGGVDDEVKKKADLVLSLSQMTLPHELARVVLVEQLYRSMTILKNEPYHR